MQDRRKVVPQEMVIVSSPAAAHNGAIPTFTFSHWKLGCPRPGFMDRYEMEVLKGLFSNVSLIIVIASFIQY